jgi:IS5 family transposase
MYKATDNSQHSFLDFNQPIGLHMNPENRWIRMADSIPWDVYEKKYAKKFKSHTGNVAKPLRLALGALIIQKKYGYSDRELIAQLTENPYYQYFIGLPGYQEEPPIDSSTLVIFRKRLDASAIMEANEYMLAAMHRKSDDNHKQDPPSSGSGDAGSETAAESVSDSVVDNKGTLTIDATCSPGNIRFPQDFSLLDEARTKLENIIFRFCRDYHLERPRTYRRIARKVYLALAKTKKRSARKIRKTIRKELGFVRRDLGYLENFLSQGYAPGSAEIKLYLTILKVYEQQKYMYDNKVHKVENRIVSITQPWIRPIVRGKVKAPVEFGAKFDLSLDDEGFGRIEKLSFDPYNESACLIDAVEHYQDRTGHYPERVLADQIYRTRANRKYCKEHGIRLSGPRVGRPGKEAEVDKRIEYQDNTDRIEVERAFSLGKRCYGMGLIRTKREDTTLASIALSVFVENLFKIHRRILYALFYQLQFYREQVAWTVVLVA